MFKVTVKGLDKALKDLEKASPKKKMDEFLRRLAEIGVATAETGYSNFKWTEYVKEGDRLVPVERSADIQVHVEPIENGYAVVAEGEQILFVEFGAGVYYNGSESYPGERPEGVVGIGEYGQGKGNRNTWGYRDGEGVTLTHGNMPSASMYYAAQEIRREIKKIAEEVFG